MNRLISITAAALVVAACGVSTDPGETTTTTTTVASTVDSDEESEPVVDTEGTPMTGEVPAEILTPIMEDAAKRFGAEASDLVIVRAESVVWNDGSLGCPQPGEFYTQALVDGYWVVVAYNGEELDYRAGSGGFWRLCESGGLPPSG